jgi:4-amino-4-deoxy-L-arabinose transferase-like glycosyltransferase
MTRWLAILAACALVYWVGLGTRGLSDSEGHRVAPAWAMLDGSNAPTHDALVPTMFEQVYLRKPPATPWLIAGTSAALGQSTLGARASSALAMTLFALGAAWAAGRLFGARAVLPTGLAAAAWPMLVPIGRTAEIEALNVLATSAAVWLILVVITRRAPSAWATLAIGLGVVSSVALSLLSKGPAGMPILIAVAGLGCVRLARQKQWGSAVLIAGGVAGGGAIFGLWAWHVADVVQRAGQTPVLQSPTEFLWSTLSLARIGAVAAMPLAALAAALPASMALLAWRDRDPIVRTLTLATAFGIGVLALGGVHNPRYAIPVLAPIVVLVGPGMWAIERWLGERRGQQRLPWGVLAGVLLVVSIGLGPVRDALRSPTNSGRQAGLDLGSTVASLASPGERFELWANDMIEARPETLLFAKQRANASGVGLRPLWKPELASADLPPAGTLLGLRTDDRSGEHQLIAQRGWSDRLEPIWSGQAHVFEFSVYRVRPVPPGPISPRE